MNSEWDAVAIGAGPGGLAFAVTAAKLGLKVLVLDEQDVPGGQIYRNIENQTPETLSVLGQEYRHGLSLVNAFRDSRATYLSNAVAWKIEADGRLCYSKNGKSKEIKAKRIVIATGAMERPAPFPGWTKPGVMGVGAVDTLYKSSGIIPEGPVTMVGSGPLMLSVAIHLNELGVKVSDFLDTTPAFSTLRNLSKLPKAMAKPGYMLKGAAMLLRTLNLVSNRKTNIARYAAKGNGKVETLSYTKGLEQGAISTNQVLVHEGIIPRTEFPRQLGLKHAWDPVQRYWYPKLNRFGRTSRSNVYVAGDGGFVHGAVAAELKGRLAAIDIASELTQLTAAETEKLLKPVFKSLKQELAPRPFIDGVYQPRQALYAVDDDTLVCRCEEVTAQQIRSAVIQGMETPEMVKSITRCGMGPCQSRMCSSALTEIIATETGKMMEEISPVSIRPPVRNLPIAELTQMTLLKEEN